MGHQSWAVNIWERKKKVKIYSMWRQNFVDEYRLYFRIKIIVHTPLRRHAVYISMQILKWTTTIPLSLARTKIRPPRNQIVSMSLKCGGYKGMALTKCTKQHSPVRRHTCCYASAMDWPSTTRNGLVNRPVLCQCIEASGSVSARSLAHRQRVPVNTIMVIYTRVMITPPTILYL